MKNPFFYYKKIKSQNLSFDFNLLMCVDTYFDTICVHPFKSAYTLSKFAYSYEKNSYS